jgi:NAD(P)-dependent dehydrogenase (short-subunit alcohol dehydrogenase family)
MLLSRPMGDIAVVTGANSGIGRAVAIYLATVGYEVYGTVRDPEKANKLLTMAEAAGAKINIVTMEVASDESVASGMAEILQKAGRVDVLVNNAGVGGNAVLEECPPSFYAEVMNVNVYGAVRCTQAVLPGMRERGRGAIINITSIAGRLAALAQSPYVASKWALEGVSEALAQELAPFGIRVAIIEPGVTKSAIFAKNIDVPTSTGAYDAHYRRMFHFYAVGIANATDPVEVAKIIEHAITTKEPKLRYPVSFGGQAVVDGRAALSDEDFVDLMKIESDDEYNEAFGNAFGIDLRA